MMNAEDGWSRREVLTGTAGGLAGASLALPVSALAETEQYDAVDVRLVVNGTKQAMRIDPRVSLLDLLRERLGLVGTKKGCDHGQCGACTVLVNGRRICSCLTLAVLHEGDEVTTIEGLGSQRALHPLQSAFIANDGFQCGFCTPGQICSAVGMLDEVARGEPSHVSDDLLAPVLSDMEIRERMSGNLCRCGAYPNIVAAIQAAAGEMIA